MICNIVVANTLPSCEANHTIGVYVIGVCRMESTARLYEPLYPIPYFITERNKFHENLS